MMCWNIIPDKRILVKSDTHIRDLHTCKNEAKDISGQGHARISRGSGYPPLRGLARDAQWHRTGEESTC
jgi:hypothetical protein